jgi:hypothetical protein
MMISIGYDVLPSKRSASPPNPRDVEKNEESRECAYNEQMVGSTREREA